MNETVQFRTAKSLDVACYSRSSPACHKPAVIRLRFVLSQAVEKTPFKSWDQNDMNVAVAAVRTRHLGVTKDRTLMFSGDTAGGASA